MKLHWKHWKIFLLKLISQVVNLLYEIQLNSKNRFYKFCTAT